MMKMTYVRWPENRAIKCQLRKKIPSQFANQVKPSQSKEREKGRLMRAFEKNSLFLRTIRQAILEKCIASSKKTILTIISSNPQQKWSWEPKKRRTKLRKISRRKTASGYWRNRSSLVCQAKTSLPQMTTYIKASTSMSVQRWFRR